MRNSTRRRKRALQLGRRSAKDAVREVMQHFQLSTRTLAGLLDLEQVTVERWVHGSDIPHNPGAQLINALAFMGRDEETAPLIKPMVREAARHEFGVAHLLRQIALSYVLEQQECDELNQKVQALEERVAQLEDALRTISAQAKSAAGPAR